MESSNSRGQGTTELLIVLLLLTAIVLTFLEYSNLEIFRGTQLSRVAR